MIKPGWPVLWAFTASKGAKLNRRERAGYVVGARSKYIGGISWFAVLAGVRSEEWAWLGKFVGWKKMEVYQEWREGIECDWKSWPVSIFLCC